MIADKGYDSDRFVHWLEERGAIVVIPSRKIAKHPRDIDWHIYKETGAERVPQIMDGEVREQDRFSLLFFSGSCFFGVTVTNP